MFSRSGLAHARRIVVESMAVAAFLLCLLGSSRALADDPPTGCRGGDDPQGPAVPPGGTCESDDPAQFVSKCWLSSGCHSGGWPWPSSGFPLNLDLWQAFGPGDYPPRKLDPVASSVPLVSREVAHFQGPSPYRERVMHNDLIDLVTGLPLLQAVDFELPFGGATFRHVRTYSENVSQISLRAQYSTGDHAGQGAFWDWNGHFWMMSENPILLIDMQFSALKTIGVADQYELLHETKRCYLVPDAHHAIPFIYQPGTDAYVAPPWFDAILQHNGTMNTENGHWIEPPTEFTVYLNRRSTKYVFEPRYEDLWEEDGHPVHLPRSEGGYGIPYYGLLREISDRYGNRVEIEYCGQRQWDCDDYTNFCGVVNELPTTDCVECCQNCNEKGQIKRARLFAGDETTASWTLLYTHRAFRHANPDRPELDQPLFYPHMLHTIHAFPGDVDIPGGLDCLTLSYEPFCSATSLDEIDVIQHPAIEQLEAGGHRWSIEARYMYSEPADLDRCQDTCPAGAFFAHAVRPGDPVGTTPGTRLMKVTVTRRSEDDAEHPEPTYTLYRDDVRGGEFGQSGRNNGVFLKSVYEPPTIDALLHATNMEDPDGVEVPSCASSTVNCLLQVPNDVFIACPDPATGHVRWGTLDSLADLHMLEWSCSDAPSATEAFVTSTVEMAGLDMRRTLGVSTGRRRVFDNRRDSSKNGIFTIYHLVQYPEPEGGSWPAEPCDRWPDLLHVDGTELIYHYPYQFMLLCEGLFGDAHWPTPRLDEVFHVAVIDSQTQECEELAQGEGEGQGGDPPPPGWGSNCETVEMRRIVEMNPAGFILRDRTWRKTGDQYEQIHQSGGDRLYVYDDHGRIAEIRSRGWDSLENPDRAGQGLIYTFEYFSDEHQAAGDLMAEGIKEGTQGQVYYVRAFERGVSGRPELITQARQFATPVTDLQGAQGECTRTEYELGESPTGDPADRPIIRKTVIRPATRWTKDGTAQCYAVERSVFDDVGRLQWLGFGSMEDPDNLAGIHEFYMHYNGYEAYGRPILQVLDADPTSPPDGEGAWTFLPEGWTRVGAAQTPLNLQTRYQYDMTHGLRAVFYPNGKEQHIAYKDCEEGGEYQWVFNDVIWPEGGGGAFKALSPAQVRLVHMGKVLREDTVKLLNTDNFPDAQGGEMNCEVLASTIPAYDASGRVIGVERRGEDETSMGAYVAYDGFGQVIRQEGPDGAITRNTYDELGRLQRTYRGTNDEHEYWGTGVLCDAYGNPEGCYDADEFPDNMVLVEKRYYGSGVTDAYQLVEIRHYGDRPVNQYFYYVPDCVDDECPPLNNEDDLGWRTLIGYDGRMRPVWEQRQDAEGNALSHTLTWYDNLDRVRLVAEYGSTTPTSVDPRSVALGALPPTAMEILQAAPKPTSLVENFYNARGLIEEARDYDVTTGELPHYEPDYTATYTYYNYADKPVEVRSPNAPIQRYAYDAKGRQIAASSFAGEIELTRTETAYDTNDRAVRTTYWERRHDATADALDESNSVRSYTHTWYDRSGKVVATVNYGTNSAADAFSSGPDPAADYDPDDPPVEYDETGEHVVHCLYERFTDTGALLTCYDYDEAGNQSAVFQPDGIVIRQTYDDLNRLVETQEERGSPPWSLSRTLNDYDDQGRLTAIREFKSNYPTDTYVTTQLIYGADVVDTSGAPMSLNNSLIREVRFPSGDTGQPSAADFLRFTYYADGSIATRTDAKGAVFTHHYDALGRRTETLIDDGAWFTAAMADLAPSTRIHRIAYAYTDDGLLDTVTAYTNVPDAGEAPVAQNVFEYNHQRNLYKDHQAHASLVVPDVTPHVRYAWLYSPASWGLNFNRLLSLDYPPLVGGGRRCVSYHCGDDAGNIDSAAGRVSLVHSSHFGSLAQYEYAGLSRRVAAQWPGAMTQTFEDGGVYAGLDRFGRALDLHYQDPTGQTLHRYQYGYDIAGNRTHARVTQFPSGGTPHDNDRSHTYIYDGRNRLCFSRMGALNANNVIIDGDGQTAPIPRYQDWVLDRTGNWQQMWRYDYYDPEGDGILDYCEWFEHEVDEANRLTAIYTDNVLFAEIVHDPNGNVVYDGQYYYQYDAWNRLLQVNELGTAVLETAAGPTKGQVVSGELGDLICLYAYDGLGRLIRKQTPVNAGETYVQTKDYYYDGVRRIQEVITRPIDSPGGDPGGTYQTGGGSRNDELAMGRADGGDPSQSLQGGIGITPDPSPGPTSETWTDREYIYGPGYVDESICQIDRDGAALFMMQDGNYNVVALLSGGCENGVAPEDCSLPPPGTLLEQYVYEPYGAVSVAENLDTAPDGTSLHAANRVGHQGLFFERFAGDYTTEPLSPTDGAGLYFNRNRFYSPTLGRFIQRDPNETALPILAALATNAETLAVAFGPFDAHALYANGPNLYQYEGSNPVNRRDPSGLYDDYDEAMDDYVGHRLYALGTLNEGARVASIGLNTALDVASSLLGIDVFQSVAVLASGGGGFWEAMDIVASVTPVGKLAKAGGTIASAFKWVHRSGKAADVLGDAARHLFKRGSYRELAKLTKGFNHKIEAHHILEARFLEAWGLSKADGPAVILAWEKHQELSNALRNATRRIGQDPSQKPLLWAAYQRVYTERGYAAWLQDIEHYFR